jgi:hypothetical protein
VIIDGVVDASGAGDAALGAGYGAGGGILIRATQSLTFGALGSLRTVGGDSANTGTTANGGTVKIRAPAASPEAHVLAGALSNTP